MSETLTFEQRQAVENRGGKLLVSAAAGSGKTKVLVDRLMGYILNEKSPANIDDFLIITYTKAAASELRGKIAAKLSELTAQQPTNKHLRQQMQRLYLSKISTVHGFCTDVLRQYAYRLDISADFRVADEGECLQLQLKALDRVLTNAYDTAVDDPDFCSFVDSQGLGRDDRQIPEIILKVYNSARCHLDPNGWLDWCIAQNNNGYTDAAETVWGRYLVDDLHNYLLLQINAMNACVAVAAKTEGFEKPAALFAATVAQLQTLYDSKTWDAIVQNCQVDFGRLTFPKNCADLQLCEQMKAVRNACKEGLAKKRKSFTNDSALVLNDLSDSVGAARGLVGLVRSFTNVYEKLKRNRGILDFSDLEHKTLDLLLGKRRSNTTAIASEIADRFCEIMVDEYQDSNEIQDAIFSALTQKRYNCFMVGDVKQSIYQFRLADPGIFIDKYNAFKSAELAADGEGRKVMLSHNFRSSAGVISAVNDVFARCMSPDVGGLFYGEAEMLHEGIPHIPLADPEVSFYGIDVQNDTYAEESSFVAERIADLLDGTHYVRQKDKLRPIKAEDIVILLRSPGSIGAQFQYALQSRGIACIYGDAADMLQSEEIATVRSILQIIDNPLQDIPLVAALTSPVFGFNAEDLSRLRAMDRYADIYTLLTKSSEPKCIEFIQILNELRSTARLCNVTQLLSAVYMRTNLLSIFLAMDGGENRLANLQQFYQIISDYESSGPKELSRLLEFLDAADVRGLPGGELQQNRNAVTIMSIHKSKGLEFPVVFLAGLSRGFNQESARAQVLCDKDLGLGLCCVDEKLRVRYPTIAKRAIAAKMLQQSISEEMRVLYVAMTRARDMLIMTYAVRNLAGNLKEIASRLDMSDARLMAGEADCPGSWVLQAAMTRTEAGELFALGGKPECASVRQIPWQIRVVTGDNGISNALSYTDSRHSEISREIANQILERLRFTYDHIAATQIPSKLTATQLKGRDLDTEIAEGARHLQFLDFRKPGAPAYSGVNYGNAIHTVMQYIDYSACDSVENIKNDVLRIVAEQRISSQQAEMVDCQKIFAFFASPFGVRIRNSRQVLREFKFSVLVDAQRYYPDVKDEKVLLQGVVDCAIIEDDSITVVDFKSDYVTEQSLPSVVEKYKSQVNAYAEALSRIYQMPVKSALLYFFSLDRFVDVI